MSTPDATVVLLRSVYIGRDKATVENHLTFVSICHKQKAAAVYCLGFCRGPASSVDRITDYNEFYSILSRRAARVRCRHGVTIRQEVGPV